MEQFKPVCERCGAAISVDGPVRENRDPAGARLCAKCAGVNAASPSPIDGGLNLPAVLIAVGLVVLVISALADVLRFGQAGGFGWRQFLGLALSGVLVLTGALLRIPTLLVIGAIIGGLALLADRLAFGSAGGFGWQQILGSVLGITVLGVGVWLSRRPADPNARTRSESRFSGPI